MPDRGHAGVGEAPLQAGVDAGGDLDGGGQKSDRLGELGGGGGGRQAHRPGVGHRRRECAHPDHQLHPELPAQGHDLGGELAPTQIRLRPRQDEKAAARAVGPPAQGDLRPGQADVDPVLDPHDGAPGPLVEEQVGVEGGQHLGGRVGQQPVGGGDAAETGVDPALETEDQQRPLELVRPLPYAGDRRLRHARTDPTASIKARRRSGPRWPRGG